MTTFEGLHVIVNGIENEFVNVNVLPEIELGKGHELICKGKFKKN